MCDIDAARTVLKEKFGHDNFQGKQQAIIEAVLNKEDSLVVLPTGGGKSLCYQLPALMFEGLTLVISPLISLMKDQVHSLKEKGIAAEYINSTLTLEESNDIKSRIDELKLLYIAPERLQYAPFLKSVNISLIAIDEAHCISSWGHDFRESYRKLRVLREQHSGVPIIALTATATTETKEDIVKQLKLKKPKRFYTKLDRENLQIIVKDKLCTPENVLELVEECKKGTTIIYSTTRKGVETFTKFLIESRVKVVPYHAGMCAEDRDRAQDRFLEGKVNVVVATTAFGMGIDKPDVRLVVHTKLPFSLEGYYQEIGRAGRDGLPSKCILYYSEEDLGLMHFLIGKTSNDNHTLKERREKKLDEVIEYCESNDICRRQSLLNHYFKEKKQFKNCGNCDVCGVRVSNKKDEEVPYKLMTHSELLGHIEEQKYYPK